MSKKERQFLAVQKKALQEAKLLTKLKTGKVKVLGISGSARDPSGMAKEESNSERLLKICLEQCKKLGAEAELLSLREYDIKPCQACYSTINTHCHYPCSCYPKGTPAGDDMSNILYDKVLAADVLLFATPINNFKISSYLSLFLDRCISLDGSLAPAEIKNTKDKELNRQQMRFIAAHADPEKSGSGMLRRFAGKVGGIIVTGHESGASLAISSLFLTLNHFGVLFPPFSTVAALASYCQTTDQDKKIVLSACYTDEVKLLAENVILAAQLARKTPATDWRYDNRTN